MKMPSDFYFSFDAKTILDVVCNIKFRLLVFALVSVSACNHKKSDVQNAETNNTQLKEQLVKANKAQTFSEQSQINDFVSRYRYKMDTSATGLRYLIYKKGKGAVPNHQSIVKIKYEVKLLDGTICYNSAITGDLQFQLGKTDLPVGLQEGIQLMGVGDKAILITPSKLGYGFTGDGDMIPPNAVLVYDVELIKTDNSN